MGTRMTARYMFYHQVAHHNNWIFFCFSAIICLINLDAFTIASDNTDNFCVFRLFFVRFIKNHMALGITSASIEAYLIIIRVSNVLGLFFNQIRIIFKNSFNSYCFFEQLSLSSLLSASKIHILLWTSLTFTSTDIGSVCHCHNLAAKIFF